MGAGGEQSSLHKVAVPKCSLAALTKMSNVWLASASSVSFHFLLGETAPWNSCGVLALLCWQRIPWSQIREPPAKGVGKELLMAARCQSTAQHAGLQLSPAGRKPPGAPQSGTQFWVDLRQFLIALGGQTIPAGHQDLRLKKTVFYPCQTLFSHGLNAAWWKQEIQPKGLFKCFHFMWLGIVTFSRGSNKFCKIVKPKQHSSFKVSKLRKMVVGLETWERCAVVIYWSKNKIPMALYKSTE